MNIIVKLISAYILGAWLLGCAPSSDMSPSITSNEEPKGHQKEKPEIFEEPAERQAHLELYNQDDFDFTQFKGIDWKNSDTFGEACSGTCVGTTPGTLGTHSFMPDFGVSADNYVTISIKGDGSCWVRSASHALFFRAFQDPKIFAAVIDNIKIVSTKYAHVPGFSGRFLHQELIDLLTTLNSLSPKDRLAQFNKAKVDLFVDYSMRALLHGHFHSDLIDKNESGQKTQKKYLTSYSWGLGATNFHVLAGELWPREIIAVSLGLADSKGSSHYINLNFSPEKRSMILLPQVAGFNNTLIADGRNSAQVRSDCKLKKQAWKSIPNSQNSRPALKEYRQCQGIFRVKKLSEQWQIKSLSECHRSPAFSIFLYMPTGNHFELMIHKNSMKAFGL